MLNTLHPQVVQIMLFEAVDKLLINLMLRPCNEQHPAVRRLDVGGFLPTMKLQHIAVANDCWFRARRYPTRPFFFS
jgi:hypothetical protein